MKTSIIPKVKNSKTTIPGQRFYCDISSTQEKSYGGSQYWVIIVDETSRMKWSHFIKKKSEMGNVIACFLKHIIVQENKKPKWIRNDNAGENQSIKQFCLKKNISINIENTSPHTPQQNGVLESGFRTLWGQERSNMSDMYDKSIRKNGLWS